MERTDGGTGRDRAAIFRRVAPRVDDVAWAWTYGYISDAVFDEMIAALAREVADHLVPYAHAAPGTTAHRPVGLP